MAKTPKPKNKNISARSRAARRTRTPTPPLFPSASKPGPSQAEPTSAKPKTAGGAGSSMSGFNNLALLTAHARAASAGIHKKTRAPRRSATSLLGASASASSSTKRLARARAERAVRRAGDAAAQMAERTRRGVERERTRKERSRRWEAVNEAVAAKGRAAGAVAVGRGGRFDLLAEQGDEEEGEEKIDEGGVRMEDGKDVVAEVLPLRVVGGSEVDDDDADIL